MLVSLFASLLALVQPLWPDEKKIPDFREIQIAAPLDEMKKPGFDRAAHRMPYLEWAEPPAKTNGACVVLLPGGGYNVTTDIAPFKRIEGFLRGQGYFCVWLMYRTPRPAGLPIYQSAWQDGQRGLRLVRAAARERGFDPERIGAIGCSAGSHLALMLGTSALTAAYERIDKTDDIPCHLNWVLAMCPAYVLTDGLTGPNEKKGEGSDVGLSQAFKFDARTCPMCFFHGETDIYSANGSKRLAEKLTDMGIASKVFLYPNRGHGPFGAGELKKGLDLLLKSR